MKHIVLPLLMILPFISIHAEMILVPDAAKGGTIITAEDGTKAVCVPPKTSPKEGMTWSFAQPLAPGWWEVTVDFAKVKGDSQRQLFYFNSPQNPNLNIYELPGNLTEKTLRFWFYTSSPVSSLDVRPDRIMPQSPRAIAQIKFKEASAPTATNEPILIDAQAPASGEMEMPKGLPAGNWKISLKASGEKKPESKAVAIGESGSKIVAPFAWQLNLYVTEPLKSLSCENGLKLTGAVLQYITPAPPRIPLNADVKPLPPFDEKQVQREVLVLKGNGISGLPTLSVLPLGKKVAVVTTWDDGIPSDKQAAELFAKHGYHATFFFNEHSVARKQFMKEIEDLGMEIGSHSATHPRAWLIPPQQWYLECIFMRTLLEQDLKHPVISFAYPFGYAPAYDTQGDFVLRGVRDAGYWSGRTTTYNAETIDGYEEPLALKSDFHFFAPQEKMDEAYKKASSVEGGIFYFWGHTYEIVPPKGWDYFESLLTRYGNKPEAWYATQGQVFIWRWLKANTKWEKVKETADGVEVAFSHPKLDPYLAKQCPMTIKLPAGATKVSWNGKELPVENGLVTLPSGQ